MKTIEVTETEMRDEYDFSNGQRGRYVGRIKPGDTDPRNCKLDVTLQIDGDLVQYFKRRALKSETSLEEEINKFLREHIDLATEKLDEARRYLASAKEFQGREMYWAAWDDTCRAISMASVAAINHEWQKDGRGIYDDANIGNQIRLARDLGLIPTELSESAELILMQVTGSETASMGPEDTKDAISAAEGIIKEIERRIENNSAT